MTDPRIAEIRKAIDARWSLATGEHMGYGAPEDRVKDFKVIEVEIIRNILEGGTE